MSEDNNWDLFAIVRSCNASNFSTPTPTPLLPTQNPITMPLQDTVFGQDLTFSQKSESFPFLPRPNSNEFLETNLFIEKQQIFQQLFQPQIVDPKVNYPSIQASNTSCDLFHQQPYQLCPVVQTNFYQTTENQQQQLRDVQLIQISETSSIDLRKPQPPKTKKRKKQQVKMVFKMTSKKLSEDDVWCWRKYGQKPIKGSLHPRSYYRCSSVKHCAAKKHIEKCSNDPNMFIVTYKGFHEHPKPTKRNANAGTARSKSFATNFLPRAKRTDSPVDARSSSTPSTVSHDPMLMTESDTPENGDVMVVTSARESQKYDSLNDDIWIPNHDEVLIPNLDAMSNSYVVDFNNWSAYLN